MGEVAPITYAAIVSALVGVISLLFWRYIASLEARLADCKEEGARDRDTVKELRIEVRTAISAVDKLADAIEASNRLRDAEIRR